jgi:hypothetical protein
VTTVELELNITSLDSMSPANMTAVTEFLAASLVIPSEHISTETDTRRQVLVVSMVAPGEFRKWQPDGSNFASFLPDDLQAALVSRLGSTAETAAEWLAPVMPDSVRLVQAPAYRNDDKCFDLYQPVRAIAFQAQVISSGLYSTILALVAFAICIPAALVAMYFSGGRVAFRPVTPTVIPPLYGDGSGYGPDAIAAAVIAERLARARDTRVVYAI